jgi:hypothetical protein
VVRGVIIAMGPRCDHVIITPRDVVVSTIDNRPRDGVAQSLAEKLADTLGWVPTLAMCGGPEFGLLGSSTSQSCAAVGNYM